MQSVLSAPGAVDITNYYLLTNKETLVSCYCAPQQSMTMIPQIRILLYDEVIEISI